MTDRASIRAASNSVAVPGRTVITVCSRTMRRDATCSVERMRQTAARLPHGTVLRNAAAGSGVEPGDHLADRSGLPVRVRGGRAARTEQGAIGEGRDLVRCGVPLVLRGEAAVRDSPGRVPPRRPGVRGRGSIGVELE